jgi:hypothetical protein
MTTVHRPLFRYQVLRRMTKPAAALWSSGYTTPHDFFAPSCLKVFWRSDLPRQCTEGCCQGHWWCGDALAKVDKPYQKLSTKNPTVKSEIREVRARDADRVHVESKSHCQMGR